MNVTIEIYTGKDFASYIDFAAKMRLEVFCEFPYLYFGSIDYERKYLAAYLDDERSMIAVARVGDVIVGISTGIPMVSNSEIVADAKHVLEQKVRKLDDSYYYGEVLVWPEYRGHGIVTKLYAAQHELIKSWGFKHVYILTVVREPDHPLKPAHYKSPDKMWEYLGFHRCNLTTTFHWPTKQTDGSVKPDDNQLEYWVRDFNY